jgi:hemin uptake protein HemP
METGRDPGYCRQVKGDLMKTHTASLNGREVNPKPERHPPLRRIFSSGELFCDSRVIIIEHAGEEYQLRITGKDKLILTK